VRIRERSPVWLSMAVLIVALLVYGLAYSCMSSDCEARGGHMEPIVGGRGGAVCDGADEGP